MGHVRDILDVSGRRRSRSPRRIRFASVAWQNALLIFLIATLPPPAAEWSSGSFAAQTSPSAGWGGERRVLGLRFIKRMV